MEIVRPSNGDNNSDRPADLCKKKRKRRYPSDNDNNNDRPAVHSSGSGFALLSADGWSDVAPFLDYYCNVAMRFVSGALNMLIYRNSATFPLRVIASLVAGSCFPKRGYSANAFKPDKRTLWADLVFGAHESPEAMLREVFGKCSGFVITRLTLRKLPYNEQVMDAMVQYLPFVTVLEAFFDTASGHDQVPRLLEIMPELRDISFRNDPEHPNANAFLRACASRKIPAVTLNYAEDVTETEILDFLSSNNRSGISREFLVVNLHRSLSATFFAAVVEACRRIECKSLYFGLSPLLSDPTDAKYSRYVVGRDESAAMYKFDAVGQVDRPFTIVVGKWESDLDFPIFHYYLNVFLGDVSERCCSLEAAEEMSICKM